MPNGTTGREGWLHRKNDTVAKLTAIVVVPVVSWLLLTTLSHGDQLAKNNVQIEDGRKDQREGETERQIIYRKIERLDERTKNFQAENERALQRQDRKLDRILERLGE